MFNPEATELMEGKEKWGVKEKALMASAGARTYNGGLFAPAGSRGTAPGQGVRGRSPLKLKSFLLLDVYWKRQICSYSPCIADSVNHLNFQSNTDSGGGGLDQSADITENTAHDRPRTQNRE